MAWKTPIQVTSPKNSWKLTSVLYDLGPDREAYAHGRWDGADVIAVRWNGTDNPGKHLGTPQSRGKATWFVLPRDMTIPTLRLLQDKLLAGDRRVKEQELATAMEAFRLIPAASAPTAP